MKSKKHILSFVVLTAIVGSIVFLSCKKDKEETVTEPICRVAITKNDSNVTTSTIEYNTDKKPIKVINYDPETNESTGYSTIEYAGSATITVKTFSVSGALKSTEVATLNSAGRVISATSNEVINSISFTYSYSYVYNSSGYLIQETRTRTAPSNETVVIDYTIQSGNVVSETYSTTVGGSHNSSKIYTYYTDKILKSDPNSFGMKIYGNSNSNPTKKMSETGSYKSLLELVKPSTLHSILKGIKADYSGTIDYTYEYDSKNYITKVTSITTYGTYVGLDVVKYIYVCS